MFSSMQKPKEWGGVFGALLAMCCTVHTCDSSLAASMTSQLQGLHAHQATDISLQHVLSNSLALQRCRPDTDSGAKLLPLLQLLLNDGQRCRVGWVQNAIFDNNVFLPPPDEFLQGCQRQLPWHSLRPHQRFPSFWSRLQSASYSA
jgi:hypothetical protein